MDTTSLNLHGLATSLNTNADAWEAAAGKELGKDFRAAAQCITSLYRSGRQASKRSYDAGYTSACQDILSMIQHGVSASTGEPELGIGKIMDWVEARLEAVKARQEEESEEEQEGKVKTSPKIRTRPYISSPSPPPPPPPPAPALTPAPTPAIPRRTITKQQSMSSTGFPDTPVLGKRQHAVMLLDSAPSLGLAPAMHASTASLGLGSDAALTGTLGGTMSSLSASATGGAPRRRTRSYRHSQNQPPSGGLFGSECGERGEAMDVEDVRERKRVTRR